jgi:sugar/nucleoside kinase (ribokinase family)
VRDPEPPPAHGHERIFVPEHREGAHDHGEPGVPGGVPGGVLVVGDLVTDVVVRASGRLRPGSDTRASIRLTGGGSAANTAAWLASLGVPVTFACRVGDDPAGAARVAELRETGVSVVAAVDPGAPTGTVVVLVDADGERTMLPDRGANDCLAPADVAAALAGTPGARYLHLSAYTVLDAGSRQAGLYALAAARDLGWRTSVDVASAGPLIDAGPDRVLGWLGGADLVLANTDEAEVLTGHRDPVRAAQALAGADRVAVVKRGAEGAVWAGAGEVHSAAAPRITAVDTTGAGDAFAAGLLAALYTGSGPVDALTAAIHLGATVAARPGARPAARPTPRWAGEAWLRRPGCGR